MPQCLYLDSSPGVPRPLLPPRAIVPLPRAPPLTRVWSQHCPPPSYQLVQKRLLALKEDEGVRAAPSHSVYPERAQVLLSPTPAKVPRGTTKTPI